MSDAPPLAGFRVVSLAVYVPGPVAAQRLRGLGAHVTKVEPPNGDPFATWCRSWYDEMSAGMDVRRLDLKTPADRATFDACLAESDVLLTAMRPGALARAGLDWDRLHARHPALCHVEIVGHAEPQGELPGHDLTYQAGARLLAPPAMPRSLVADLGGAERVVTAALALLLSREREGARRGRRAEVALADAAHAFAAPMRHGITAESAILGGGFPGYAMYPTREGWIAVAALEPHFWVRLLAELGLEATAERAAFEEAFSGETAEYWEGWAVERGLPLVAVREW